MIHLKRYFRFIIPSLIGIFLFMVPVPVDGHLTIPIAIFSGWLERLLANFLPQIMTVLITISFLGTVAVKCRVPIFANNSFIRSLFDVPIFWMIMRMFGALFAICVLFEWGPEWLSSRDTGGTLLYDLLPVLFSVFLFAGLLLPLLLDFGLLEFFGALMTKMMRPVFKLPGRASIDCITSWLGDGTIGVLLTSKQYEEGFYTRKEAAIIGTSFSVVSITFSLVVISQVGLGHMFASFYFAIVISGVIAAMIMPRIPPLSRKPDTYINGEKRDEEKESLIPDGYTLFTWGLEQAVTRAENHPGMKHFLMNGIKNILDMWIGVAPIVMAIGTFGLIVATYTPVFQWLGMPFIPLLELLQVPEAKAAAETLVVGFADMFLPSIIGASITSEMTRFIIAAVSVTQLIYMSEVGGVLLGSKIPISFFDLVVIFLLRTIITLPIITMFAHFIF